MKSVALIFLVGIICLGPLRSQTIQLRTTYSDKGHLSGQLQINKPGTWYKVYPANLVVPDSFSDIKYFHEIIDYAQVVYQSCRSINDNTWNNKRLKHMIDRWGVDTLNCSTKQINSFINGAVASGQDATLYYAIDQDNDLSLLDETFHPIDCFDLKPMPIIFERFSNDSTFSDTATIKINKARYSDAGDLKGFDFEYLSYKKGTFKLDDETINVTLMPGGYYTFHSDPIITFSTSDSSSASITIGQYWQYGSQYFKVDRVAKSGSTISLSQIASNAIFYSNQSEFPAPPIFDENVDAIRDSPYNFTYIYFWNIDCAPCLQQLPEMQSKYDRIASKGKPDFQVLLVSTDKPDRTRAFLRKKEITFKNIETFGNSPLYNNYGIEFFPSQYLVDNKGKVIYTPRNTGDFNRFWTSRE